MDLFDHLTVGDIGDLLVDTDEPAATMKCVHETMARVYRQGSIPIVLGGDHWFTRNDSRVKQDSGRPIGLVHLDAHFDNTPSRS